MYYWECSQHYQQLFSYPSQYWDHQYNILCFVIKYQRRKMLVSIQIYCEQLFLNQQKIYYKNQTQSILQKLIKPCCFLYV
ncbi:unnamed protein product [Paramecium sonneborni]|uniref:Uncharacterized protein n=1 Tax=Paramecium sonneborni TaxID=65129 RepID=A0A8S1NMF1_9CILI|nr:unnamed protein product [Paramecium sonneborni]